jgi:serine/threonine protein kinase
MPQFLHKDVKDLLWKMLTVDPSKRITVAEIKEHPWYKSHFSTIEATIPIDQMVNGYVVAIYRLLEGRSGTRKRDR